MALPPSTNFRQDLPPAGGYVKPPGFPAEGCVAGSTRIPHRTPRISISFPFSHAHSHTACNSFRKRSPVRGPAGIWMIGGVLGVMGFSLWRLTQDVEERK